MRRAFIALGFAILLGLPASALGLADTAQVNAWTKPHQLVFADGGDITTLNPHLSQYIDVLYLAQLTMAWLIRWDRNNRPYPELATDVPTKANGDVSPDGKTITLHLRRGVVWSDGAPFSADDVAFTIRVVQNPANNEEVRGGFENIASVDEPDKYTIVLHLKKQAADFIQGPFSTSGANPCVLPEHLLAQYPNINDVPYNAQPVGIGPFKVERWDRSQEVVLTANPLYWRGRPKLDRIVYKIIPNPNSLLVALQAHEIDMWLRAPSDVLPQLQTVEGYDIIRHPSYIWNHLDFNLTHPILDDVRVRRALQLATDRRTILDKLLHGVGKLTEVPTPSAAPYYVAGIPLVPFDIARANALLDSAGWIRGSDGVRSKNGTRLELTFAISTNISYGPNMAAIIQADWSQIGVALNIVRYPPAIMFAPQEQGGIINGTKWDVTTFGFQADAMGGFGQIYGCDSFPPNGQNYPRWCNRTAQTALDNFSNDYDAASRQRDIDTFVREFIQDVPVVVLGEREDIYVVNRDIKNFEPNQLSPFDNIMNVDI